MDAVAEKLSEWFGSTPFILAHVLWFTVWLILHFVIRLDADWRILTIIVSLEAILLALLVLRGQNVQSKRMEESVQADLKKSDNQLRLLREINKELKGQRYQR